MEWSSVLRALAGGALIGLAASIALLAHGKIAGISGALGRMFAADGGRSFRIPFVIGLVVTGIVAAIIAPASIGAAVRGTPLLAVAGVLVGVGTALGNGCTSGHGVCGLSRGSGTSLAAVLTFMVTGAITVAILGASS
ncbi:MAG: YeeE/YedE family protein [Deltaproteobacteria bacterium]|nr:YeeE/YedE family protein [Deltaproteobacteria bacterium]